MRTGCPRITRNLHVSESDPTPVALLAFDNGSAGLRQGSVLRRVPWRIDCGAGITPYVVSATVAAKVDPEKMLWRAAAFGVLFLHGIAHFDGRLRRELAKWFLEKVIGGTVSLEVVCGLGGRDYRWYFS